MNDFTKEELITIWLYIPGDISLELKNKIQSVIDNYCEHSESQSNLNYEVDQCKKCGKLFI